MNVRIAALPKGYDPDSFVRKQGKEAFENIIKSSKDLFDYKMNLLMNRFNKDGVRGKAAIATLMLPTIARISNEILKAAFLKKLSDMLSIDEAALRAELKKVKIDYSYTVREEKPLYKQNEARHAELLLLSLILEEPGTLSVVNEKLGFDEFRDTRIRKIIDLIYKFCESKKVIIPSKIINHFENDEIKRLISKAVSIRETIMNKEKVLFDCINRVREDNFREDLKKLQNEIRSAHDLKDKEKVDILLLRYNDLIKSHRK
jgi:DNA primase